MEWHSDGHGIGGSSSVAWAVPAYVTVNSYITWCDMIWNGVADHFFLDNEVYDFHHIEGECEPFVFSTERCALFCL